MASPTAEKTKPSDADEAQLMAELEKEEALKKHAEARKKALEQKAAAAKEASTFRERFRPMLEEFMAGNPAEFQAGNPSLGNPLSKRAAAFLAAHAIFKLGEARAAKLTKAECRTWADGFTVSYPAAWGALVKQDVARFEKVLGSYKRTPDEIMCDTPQGYQAMIERLTLGNVLA